MSNEKPNAISPESLANDQVNLIEEVVALCTKYSDQIKGKVKKGSTASLVPSVRVDGTDMHIEIFWTYRMAMGSSVFEIVVRSFDAEMLKKEGKRYQRLALNTEEEFEVFRERQRQIEYQKRLGAKFGDMELERFNRLVRKRLGFERMRSLCRQGI